MGADLERLKQRIPLLDFLQRHHWSGQRVGARSEFVGLCPLHEETHPSFYVNPRKNLFYCHGCGRGGDLIRFVELALHLSFRDSVAYLEEELAPAAQLLTHTAAFYQLELHRYPEGIHYLAQRGVRDPTLIEELAIGYARGGNLRPHLQALGYSLEQLLQAGLIGPQGHDAFCRRVIFPCAQHDRIVNLYGRSIGAAFPHRLLPRSKGGLFAWHSVRHFPDVILVEGLLDLAVLWQAGFRNTTCAVGTHLTPAQFAQLCDRDRGVYLAFDQDENHAGQQAARILAQGLHHTGLSVRIVRLPVGHDPNSYFATGASKSDFLRCLEEARLP
ncbi:MAG TPA: CHC2 zinc finger domain-containing protein [Terriglobales bacterium]